MNITRSIILASIAASLSIAARAQTAVSALSNLSSLGSVGRDAGNLIAGFVIEGTAPKDLLIRATGPGLEAFGVGNPAAAVDVNVYDSSGNLVASNSGFQNDPDFMATEQTAAQLNAFPLSDPGDSEVLATLPPGSYSVEIAPSAADATEGDALIEVIDADAPGSDSIVANLSTRGQVGATAGSLTASFVVSGTAPKNVLIRGIGPDLALFGVDNTAGAVDLNVYDNDDTLVGSNGGFQNDPNAAAIEELWGAVGAFAVSDPSDSELLLKLAPGIYTIEMVPADQDAADGVGLLEVYDADRAVSVSRGD